MTILCHIDSTAAGNEPMEEETGMFTLEQRGDQETFQAVS